MLAWFLALLVVSFLLAGLCADDEDWDAADDWFYVEDEIDEEDRLSR